MAEVVNRLRLPHRTLSRLIPFPLTPSNGGASPRATEPAHSKGEAWEEEQEDEGIEIL